MATAPYDHTAQSDKSSALAEVREILVAVGQLLASLKLTVTLFALSTVLILVGTLAQVDKGMWDVMNDYFLAWIAWVDFQVFFPRTWFPSLQNIRGGVPFPGGATIGALLVINLLSAHLVRFKVQAKGTRLWGGTAVIVAGVVITGWIIVNGHNSGGLQGRPPFSWDTLWVFCQLALALAAGTALYGCGHYTVRPEKRVAEAIVFGVLAGALTLVTVWTVWAGEAAQLDDSGMRILWQLIQGTLAGAVLLIGCVMVFNKRGPVVLIHMGVGLLMFGQFWVAQYDVEEKISMVEGEEVHFARDIRQTELAVVVDSTDEADDVVVIPGSLLLRSAQAVAAGEDGVVRHDDLPFDFEVVEYQRNHDLVRVSGDDSTVATAGIGLQEKAVKKRTGSGAGGDSSVDHAAAYVRFFDKQGGDLGVHLMSQILAANDWVEPVEVDGRSYDVALRFKRNYKSYRMQLLDVSKDDYIGTSTPSNYSSDVRLIGENGDVNEPHIWMNNPLRYQGETFYQSDYFNLGTEDAPREGSALQVVTNSGWMIPYIACMIVGMGMVGHFVLTLFRFLGRRATQTPVLGRPSRWAYIVPTAVVLLCGIWFLSKMRPPKTPADKMDIHAFGELPVVDGGRVKPFDTLARNTLKVISTRETFKDSNDDKQPAIRWLLDVISNKPESEDHHVFRIDNLEVLNTLGLQRRKGFMYSLAEIRSGFAKFEREVQQARQKEPEARGVYETKLVELARRMEAFLRVGAAFRLPDLPPLPTAEEMEQNPAMARDAARRFYREVLNIEQGHKQAQPPLAVPVGRHDELSPKDDWVPYTVAWAYGYLDTQLLQRDPDPGLASMNAMMVAYGTGDATAFSREIEKYQNYLEREEPEILKGQNTMTGRMVEKRFGTFYAFEAFFNRVAPFYYCMPLYVLASLLAMGGWLGYTRVLSRTSLWLIALAFVLHTIALCARMYISGRPPVTNLYSSAIFISWGAVIFGGMLEMLYRNGIGNVVAAVTGFTSLFIAHNLAGEGDTLTVLQAVLDTQFWLATHVVTISYGYAATFVAGAVGIIYILAGLFTPMTSDLRRQLARMIYGVVCFAMFFSFVGTVLGGLWADDSWGRFWGWDPKENGALMIVVWNALLLHARWDGMVKERGMAVLAVCGNIVTAWSWFGVNQLGVGLHSYGFTQGMLFWLIVFGTSQILLIGMGCLPRQYWMTYQADHLKSVAEPETANA